MENYKLEYVNKYIDLKTNGRLFPSWILANFKKYKLPTIIKGDKDPCKRDIKSNRIEKELRKYQIFLSKYIDFRSPYRNILIYHGMGSGKTASAINIYNALYSYTPGWNVFILIKAALKDTWLDELKDWLNKDEYEFRFKNIIFIHYDSPFADRNFLDALKNIDSSKKSLYIIDEVHNFIRNVYTNISSSKGKRAQIIYDYIIQDKRENPDTRVILLSGTPAINNPFEFALLFNMLRSNLFPKSENEFNHHFITSGIYQSLNNNNKNLFQRRIIGLVSYYFAAVPGIFASKTIHYVDVIMSEYQQDIYGFYEEIEKKIAAKMIFSGRKGSQVYKSYTRQACNFVFPPISQKINGENRPRPNKFRISEREAEKLSEGKKVDKNKETFTNILKYKKAIETYINALREYFYKYNSDDINKKYTILNDVKIFKEKYYGKFDEFHIKEKNKSSLYNAMHTSSAKMLNIIFNIMMASGPTIVYSNYVAMEGLEVFKIYLEFFNFYSFMKTKKIIKDKLGYVEYHGGISDTAERKRGMLAFNNQDNKYGEHIKIMLISPAGSEGLSLMNVKQVHIMEPYWNEVRINQMVARGIRQCSHALLPLNERHVDIFRYKSVRKNINTWTTDQYIEDLARSKDSLIQSFLDAMKEVAIDCVLNKNHNMLQQEYKCFQFEEPSLFTKYIGPAYKPDFYDDMKIDNGLNSMNSIVIKIKVMKINAVKLLSKPDEQPRYSKPKLYWFYQKNGTVYDYSLHYVIGKIQIDEDGIPVKLDKDTYIIDYIIPIPTIED